MRCDVAYCRCRPRKTWQRPPSAERRAAGPDYRQPGQSVVTLQEYAGVESFQSRFRSVQPSDANCLGGGDAAEVAALAVEPAANGIWAFEGVPNSLLKTEQLRQPLARQLLRIRCPCPPALNCTAACPQNLGQLLLGQAHSLLQDIESLAGRHLKEG